MTRAELLARITTSEFMEWRVLEELEPFGERGAYLRAGIIASTIANGYRDPKTPALKPKDFIPDCEREDDGGQSVDQMFAAMQMIAAMQNASVEDKPILVPIQ